MYDYVALRIDANPCNETITDLLAAFLADIEFESFEPDDKGLLAYVRKDKYQHEAVKEMLKDFPIQSDFKTTEEVVEGEDWNSEWEKNYFKPIKIADRLLIRSSFHTDVPESEIEIVIDPKMAFGTGHHSTTAGVSTLMLDTDLKGMDVIDMGTGTGILSILAKKLGAQNVVGIDIDEFAIENAKENGALNNEEIEWRVGDDKELEDLEPADIFLANINLNVITSNIDKYVSRLKKGGKIFLSGFLKDDREKILESTASQGLKLERELCDNNWLAMSFVK